MRALYNGVTIGFVFILLLTPAVVTAATYTVRKDGSGDFTTVTAAVNSAAGGDTIDVGPGTYAEHITINKSLTVLGTSGHAATILDGNNSGQVVRIDGVIDVHLEGFSITRGLGSSASGMVVLNGASTTVEECTYYNNYATFDGGAFYVRGPSTRLVLNNCTFFGNHADHNAGAGLVVMGGFLDVYSCVFKQNTTNIFAGAMTVHESTLNVTSCLFWENTSGDVAGAIYAYRAVGGSITSSTFYRNRAPGSIAGTLVLHYSAAVSVAQNIIAEEQSRYGLYYEDGAGYHACNVFWNNNDGPIYGDALDATEVVANPLFCSPLMGEFGISDSSPAAPANNPCTALIGAYPEACSGPVVTKSATWGQIKQIYSER